VEGRIPLDSCASSQAYAGDKSGVQLWSTADPSRQLRLTSNPYPRGTWTLQLFAPTVPGGSLSIDSRRCAGFGAQAEWGEGLWDDPVISGRLNADCMMPDGSRLVVNATFDNCE
jgi:hypothetical protein